MQICIKLLQSNHYVYASICRLKFLSFHHDKLTPFHYLISLFPLILYQFNLSTPNLDSSPHIKDFIQSSNFLQINFTLLPFSRIINNNCLFNFICPSNCLYCIISFNSAQYICCIFFKMAIHKYGVICFHSHTTNTELQMLF